MITISKEDYLKAIAEAEAEGQTVIPATKQTEYQGLGNIVSGAYTPVLAKHSNHFSLVGAIAVAVVGMQRNFEPMRRQVEGRAADPAHQRPSEANHPPGVRGNRT